MVIDDDDIELEVRFLTEGTRHGVADGLLPVVYGDDDGCLYVEFLFVEVWTTVERRVDLCAYLCQMGCGGMLHLYLHLTVAWVHIIKLFHARGSRVCLLLGIEFLVDVEDRSAATEEESQGIEPRMSIVVLSCLHGEGVKQRCLDKSDGTEIKIIADTT